MLCHEALLDDLVDLLHVDRFDEFRLRGQQHFATTTVGEPGLAAILLEQEVDVPFELGRSQPAPTKQIDGRRIILSRQSDDQRSPGFVDEYAVGFVDQREVVAALNRWLGSAAARAERMTAFIGPLLRAFAEPIPEKVESRLLGRAVGDSLR